MSIVYTPLVEQILAIPHQESLGPGTATHEARPLLEQLSPQSLAQPHPLGDTSMALACCSALWLHHNYLDHSHRISQQIDTIHGSFWHGIMHRREGDFGNAKYWFRRVGEHPIFPALAQAAREEAQRHTTDDQSEYLLQITDWDPFAWIDLCQAVVEGESMSEALCLAIQRREWRLLFDFCFQEAVV